MFSLAYLRAAQIISAICFSSSYHIEREESEVLHKLFNCKVTWLLASLTLVLGVLVACGPTPAQQAAQKPAQPVTGGDASKTSDKSSGGAT